MARKHATAATPTEAPTKVPGEQAQGAAPSKDDAQAPPVNTGIPGRKPPVFECRLGRVKAVVWENLSDNGVWFSITFGRSYKEEKAGGQWKTASSFGKDDLLVVAECARQCFLWIVSQQQGGNVQQVAGEAQKQPNSTDAPTPAATTNNEEPIPF